MSRAAFTHDLFVGLIHSLWKLSEEVLDPTECGLCFELTPVGLFQAFLPPGMIASCVLFNGVDNSSNEKVIRLEGKP